MTDSILLNVIALLLAGRAAIPMVLLLCKVGVNLNPLYEGYQLVGKVS